MCVCVCLCMHAHVSRPSLQAVFPALGQWKQISFHLKKTNSGSKLQLQVWLSLSTWTHLTICETKWAHCGIICELLFNTRRKKMVRLKTLMCMCQSGGLVLSIYVIFVLDTKIICWSPELRVKIVDRSFRLKRVIVNIKLHVSSAFYLTKKGAGVWSCCLIRHSETKNYLFSK